MAAKGVQKYFFFTKQRVSSDWKDLAFFLGFPDSEIRNIDGRNRDDMSRCMDMLQEWKRRKGNAATIEVLMEALSSAGLQSVLHGLKANFPELTTQQVTLTQPLQETTGQSPSEHLHSRLQLLSLGQPHDQHNTRGQPTQDTTQPKQETTGQPSSEQPTSWRQPQQETAEQLPPQDTTEPKQQSTGEQTSSDTSRQPQQETTGLSSCSDYEGGTKKLFIIHGGEDRDTLVEPLAHEIVDQGVPKESVFYNEWSIEDVQSVKESIALAIQDRSCKLAVIVFSEHMMKKHWPRKELEEFLKRGIRFFPIFYGVKPDDVRKEFSPMVADTQGVEIPRTGEAVDEILIAGTASKIRKILQKV
ncbi:Nlrc4p [Branchiostoma belcheri]|nr:Nlrc4p [Branchiostoma belcheri]